MVPGHKQRRLSYGVRKIDTRDGVRKHVVEVVDQKAVDCGGDDVRCQRHPCIAVHVAKQGTRGRAASSNTCIPSGRLGTPSSHTRRPVPERGEAQQFWRLGGERSLKLDISAKSASMRSGTWSYDPMGGKRAQSVIARKLGQKSVARLSARTQLLLLSMLLFTSVSCSCTARIASRVLRACLIKALKTTHAHTLYLVRSFSLLIFTVTKYCNEYAR